MDDLGIALRHLCRWAAAAAPDAVPADVLARIGAVAADTIACALGAAQDAELSAWTRDTDPDVFTGACTVLGKGQARASPRIAARHNAVAANWLQLDEGHHRLMCHAGIYCVPAALAECEAADLSLGQFLHAVALGYEMTCRLAAAWTFGAAPVHPHSLWSTLGATATLGLLRGLDGDTLHQALLHAASCAAPRPFAIVADGGLAANLWVGKGVEQAFACTAWADGGLPAPAQALARLGEMLGVQTDAAACTDDLGGAWAVRLNYFKVLPCAGQSHAALEALLRVREDLLAQGCEVFDAGVRIDAEVHAFAVGMAQRDVRTSLAARFSIPHLLAVAWLHGRTDADALGAAFLRDARVARLREAIRLRPLRPALPPPHHRAARVTVTLGDGRSGQAQCLSPLGSQAKPLDSADIARKCLALASGRHTTLLRALLDLPGGGKYLGAIGIRSLLR
ncbi:MmgE/PrpD family protein [Bordetella bronchialis]|uniref:MmgE/PrpD family protein n=1 Tax=Bordetella bronchialis TaxID=463025 RepID=UPI003D0774A4